MQALLTVLVLFCLQPEGFRNRQLRPLLAQLLGISESRISPGRMSYDLRRLRLHGLMEHPQDSALSAYALWPQDGPVLQPRLPATLAPRTLGTTRPAPGEVLRPSSGLRQIPKKLDASIEDRMAA